MAQLMHGLEKKNKPVCTLTSVLIKLELTWIVIFLK